MKLDGNEFLIRVLRRYYPDSEREVLTRAILESACFIHPEVVAQTRNLPILRARRMDAGRGEKKNTVVAGEFVSDNFPPDYVFRAATSDERVQSSTVLCHIYGGKGEARDTFFYTNLANLCLVPAFLAKLCDTDEAIVALLKQCAFVLYGFDPRREFDGFPPDPAIRDRVRIATPPRGTLVDALSRRRDKNYLAARGAGFLFANDGTLDREDPWVREMMARTAVSSLDSP